MIDLRGQLTYDGAAVVMLCSRLALRDVNDSGVAPLTLKEWNVLARKIHDSDVRRPGALLGMGATEISKLLAISKNEADRIAQLVDRGGPVALELEQLSTTGIWCITRVDDGYPLRLKDSLKHQAPPVL